MRILKEGYYFVSITYKRLRYFPNQAENLSNYDLDFSDLVKDWNVFKELDVNLTNDIIFLYNDPAKGVVFAKAPGLTSIKVIDVIDITKESTIFADKDTFEKGDDVTKAETKEELFDKTAKDLMLFRNSLRKAGFNDSESTQILLAYLRPDDPFRNRR